MLSLSKNVRPFYRTKIGNREVVGPSMAGVEIYYDRVDHPCPPIRFKAPCVEFDALRAKEKQDWRNMTIDEKKKLYRYSFCRTIKEVEAPTAEWKSITGSVLFMMSIPIFLFVLMKKTVFPPLPDSLSDENKKKLVRFYIDARVDPIDGISTKWDYEKNQWKEKPFFLMRDK